MSPASSGGGSSTTTLQVERYIGACLFSSRKTQQQQQQKFNSGGYSYCYPDTWGSGGGMPLITFANQEEQLLRLAGAPLIQAHRYRRKKKNDNDNNNNKKTICATTIQTTTTTTTDTVINDESANCLPRIIKPRKRRKKDRKPPQRQDSYSTDSASPDACLINNNHNNATPFTFEFCENLPSDAPKLHHSFDEVKEAGGDLNGNQSLCQCRYCDPAGLIWDVDRNCFSPYLTIPTTIIAPQMQQQTKPKQFCLLHSFANVSLNDRNSDLEVSTEIVTSPNGHRDLEIKFFSQKDCLKRNNNSNNCCQCNG